MRFALVNNERAEASPKSKGTCPGCDQPVTSKCGKQRIWHWAHDAKKVCDQWWETETNWHRSWKDNFPREWQEKIQHDVVSGEKHIADICTAYELVIEFQHSHIDPLERVARENFYGNMIWVVDGSRLKRDHPRFVKGKNGFRGTHAKGFFLSLFPDECFPSAWLESKVPVIFDFRDAALTEQQNIPREPLWCLLPGRAEGYAVVIALSHDQLVPALSSRPQLLPAQEYVDAFAQHIRNERKIAAIHEHRRLQRLARNANAWRRQRRRL